MAPGVNFGSLFFRLFILFWFWVFCGFDWSRDVNSLSLNSFVTALILGLFSFFNRRDAGPSGAGTQLEDIVCYPSCEICHRQGGPEELALVMQTLKISLERGVQYKIPVFGG